MVTENLDRLVIIFEYENDNRFLFSNVNRNATNNQLFRFASAFNSLQRNVAHTFSKEERFVLTQAV